MDKSAVVTKIKSGWITGIWPHPTEDKVLVNSSDPCEETPSEEVATITQQPTGHYHYEDDDGSFTTKATGAKGLSQLKRAMEKLYNEGWNDWTPPKYISF